MQSITWIETGLLVLALLTLHSPFRFVSHLSSSSGLLIVVWVGANLWIGLFLALLWSAASVEGRKVLPPPSIVDMAYFGGIALLVDGVTSIGVLIYLYRVFQAIF